MEILQALGTIFISFTVSFLIIIICLSMHAIIGYKFRNRNQNINSKEGENEWL